MSVAMNGIAFGNKHSYTDFSLILNSKEIEVPKIKTEIIDIPGADGQLDFTEFFGGVKYENRKLTFNFTRIGSRSTLVSTFSSVQNALHGQKKNIFLDDDPVYYYTGRLSVDKVNYENGYGTITISADCEPYKYKLSETTVSKTVSGSGTVTLTNLKKNVSPKITTTAAVTIAWTGGSASVPVGTDLIIPEFVLAEGSTTVTITGTGTVTFKYREGGL